MSGFIGRVCLVIWVLIVTVLIIPIMSDINDGYSDEANKLANHVYMKCPEAIEYVNSYTQIESVFTFLSINSVRKVIFTCEMRRLMDAIQTSKLDDQISIPDLD